jgi:IPT/TIG domain
MALFKRHLGLRVGAVAVVSALVVLGLEAPASATPPTISSFSPTSGPAGCVVVITGTNFKDPIVTSVDIGGTPVSEFKVVSGTEIWATVAGGAGGTIHVANASATASSASDFTDANPGGCSPTITDFTPCGGHPSWGTVVTVIGTNLLKSSGTAATASVGGDVRFAPYTATATHTGAPETPKQLSVLVPLDAADGPIRVSTFNDVVGEGAVLSASAFQVSPPDVTCLPADHARSITLSLRRHLVARGKVIVLDGFTDCVASVPVRIQRRVSGPWRTIGRTTTTDTGAYKKRIKDRPGKYRSVAPPINPLPLCFRANSPVRTGS